MRKNICLFLLCSMLLFACSPAEKMYQVRVHFLYGSKPKKKYKYEEHKWFGGKLGGHAGVEISPNRIVDFGPSGSFHYVAHDKNRHSHYMEHDTVNFYGIFGTHPDSVQRMTITIPVTFWQKHKLDSVANAYLEETPYDYAFLGMRCGAAAYDLLAQAGIVKKLGRTRNVLRIFYPRKLRRKLMRMAKKNGWHISRRKGTNRRKWERE